VRAQALARSHTVAHTPRPRPRAPPERPPADSQTTPRPRALSLRSRRSLTSLNGKRPANTTPVPPVPALPRTASFAALSKSARSSAEGRPPPASKMAPALSTPKVQSRRKQKGPAPLNPPDLEHIPTLLPVFIEMVSRCARSVVVLTTRRCDLI
jgi:hypothetical protein